MARPPLVTAFASVVGLNGLLPFTSMFKVEDQDNDPLFAVQRYRLRDNIDGGGFFVVNGVAQQANQLIDIPAGQIGRVFYQGNNAKTQETFSVQVLDNEGLWSNLATGTVSSGNSTPVVTAKNGRVAAFQTVQISKQFSVFDLDNDNILRYVLIDKTNNFGGGHFELRGGVLNQAQPITIDANDLPQLLYRGADVGREVETIGVQAFDGFSFSQEVTFEMVTTAPPVVTGKAGLQIVGQEKRLARTLFDFADADNDAIFAASFVDRRLNPDGGYFEFKGQRLESAKWFTVFQKDLDQLFYVGGTNGPQTEGIGVQVFDGAEFSNVANFDIQTLPRPSVTVSADIQVKARHFLNFDTGSTGNTSGATNTAGVDFLKFATGVEKFLFVDRRLNANGGHFVFKGAQVPSATWFTVLASELGQLEYEGGRFGFKVNGVEQEKENISVIAIANGIVSPQTTFSITTLTDANAPDLTFFGASSRLGAVLDLRSLFVATDKDDDLIRTFGIFDTGDAVDSGYFTVNGVRQPALTWIQLDFSLVSTVKYVVPSAAGSEVIRMFVSDGTLTSQVQSALISAIATPVIISVDNDISVDTLEGFAANALIQQTDAGPPLVRYEVFDENFANIPDRSGRLFLRNPGPGNLGEPLLGGIVHTLTAEEFSRLELQGSEADFGRQLDGVLIRATNGITGWSEWQRINVNTDPIGAAALVTNRRFSAVTEVTPTNVTKTVITYTFIDGGNQTGGSATNPNYPPLPIYYPPGVNPTPLSIGSEAAQTRALDQRSREMHRDILAYFEEVMNVDFVEVPFEVTASQAAITFGAWAGVNHNWTGNTGDGRGTPEGDIWYNTAEFPVNSTVNVGQGGQYRRTAFAQIASVLGLRGPTGTPPLSIFNNFDYNTVMSSKHDSTDNPFAAYPEQVSTLMLYDIIRLQEIYGANLEHNTGANQYFFSATESHQTTLWDAGGLDTINMTIHTVGETIDLREGTWSSVNGVPQSLRIAYGTQIENARGGSGNDNLRGNEIANILFGNAGNDTLRGGGGNDVLRGGAGDDIYQWSLGDGIDLIQEFASGGTDTIQFFDPSGSISTLEDDFTFRRFGNDLRIDLTLDQGMAQGSVTIEDFANAASQVEVLKIHTLGAGTQIGGNIDLVSIFNAADNIARRFTVTDNPGTNGFLAVRV